MNSYQNLALLENLYRLKALGYSYIDLIKPNQSERQSSTLPNTYDTLIQTIKNCHLCDLSKSRSQSMSGFGSLTPKVLFVDAYVSSAEDETNNYYAGRSGTMLKDMIEKVLELTMNDVYITHAVKCKPFGFQHPSASECSSCFPYLQKQLEILSPKIIVTLGEEAYRLLTNDESDFERLSGETIPYNTTSIIPLHHPSFLIRNPSYKSDAMRALLNIKQKLR